MFSSIGLWARLKNGRFALLHGGLHCPWPGIELKRMKILKKKFAI
jgi:hypothetical protein